MQVPLVLEMGSQALPPPGSKGRNQATLLALEHPVTQQSLAGSSLPPSLPFHLCTLWPVIPATPPALETSGICANMSSAGTCPTPITATTGSAGPPSSVEVWGPVHLPSCTTEQPKHAPLRLNRSFPSNTCHAAGALLSDGGSKCCLVGPG